MKQTNYLFKVLLTCLFLNTFNYAQSISPIKTNWANSMLQYADAGSCLELLSDNKMIFDMKVRFWDDQVQNYPAMKFYIHGEVLGTTMLTAAVQPQDVYPVIVEGIDMFEASFQIEFDLNILCNLNGNQFCYKLEYQLVTDEDPANPELTVSYPYYRYPNLFPPSIFDITGNGGRANYWVKIKDICCYELDTYRDPCSGTGGTIFPNNGASPFIPPNPLVANPSPSNSVASGMQVEILSNDKKIAQELEGIIFSPDVMINPNPFSDRVNISMIIESPEKIDFEWFDVQGRSVYAKEVNFLGHGFEKVDFDFPDWMPGVYYLRIRSNKGVKVLKIIKSE